MIGLDAGRSDDQGTRGVGLVSRHLRLRAVLERHERVAIVLLLLAGLIARIAWVAQGMRLKPFVHEMQQVAVAFANTGVLADAYYAGQGPTAHVGPVMPIIGGMIYRLAGVGTPAAEMILTGLALTFLGIALLAFYASFRRLGLPVEWRLAALAAAALLPLNFSLEARDLRLFEGALTVALLACNLLLVLRMDARPELRLRDYVVPAAIGGLLALVNPPGALAAYAALGILTLKRAPPRRWIGIGLIMAVGLAVFIGPWAARNERVFGRLILTRDNFALEHALGFHPAAVAPADPRAVFVHRLRSIHPFANEAARAEVARVGEIAFMDRIGAETKAWEQAHPGDAARIAVRHAGEFWLPPRWMWRVYDNEASAVAIRQAIMWISTLAAFAALAWGLIRDPFGPRLYVACTLIVPCLPYIMVQPILRYRYIVAVLTLFLAAEFASRVWDAFLKKTEVSR